MKKVCAAIVACLAGTAPADVVLFDNFAPGDRYLGNTGWTLMNGGPLQAHIEDAAVFTVSGGDFALSTITLAVGLLGGPNVLHVSVHADGGGVPGAVLGAVTLTDRMPMLPTDPSDNPPPVVADFAGSITLLGGVDYWISLSSDTTTDSWAAWNQNTTDDLGLRAWRQDGGAWSPHTGDPRGTFRVRGELVPTPAGAMVFAAAALGAARRRRPASTPRA